MRKPERSWERPASNTDRSLARLLETADLAAIVPHLRPETLHALISRRGLEDSGALVSSSTPEQLAALLDLDLWRSPHPGRDETFDPGRFGLWIETLVAFDASEAARTFALMDKDLVVAGLAGHIRVFDPAALLSPDPDEGIDGGFEVSQDLASIEVGGYLVRPRRLDAWGATIDLLTALSDSHPETFREIMGGCRRLSDSPPEIDGLDNLLLAPDQLFHEISLKREDRRAERGYLTPAEARAFLLMARRPSGAAGSRALENPIVKAFLARHHAPATLPHPGTRPPHDGTTSVDPRERAERVVALLGEAGGEHGGQESPPEDSETARSRLTRLVPLLAYVEDHDPETSFARSRELAFLANALVSGCSLESLSMTAQEASLAAMAVCNLGLEHDAEALSETFLLHHDLVTPFQIGWASLFDEVSLPVARALLAALEGLHPPDRDLARDLASLGRELARQCEAATPWVARDALDAVAALDIASWATLLGLLNECPVIRPTLAAVTEHRTGPVSATAFEFIANRTQIEDIRAFLRALPRALRG